jgi:hypothetical protein
MLQPVTAQIRSVAARCGGVDQVGAPRAPCERLRLPNAWGIGNWQISSAKLPGELAVASASPDSSYAVVTELN